MSLEGAECDIVVVAPVVSCGAAKVAPLGIPAMLNAGGAVRAVTPGSGTSSGTCSIQLRGTGKLLVWADRRPASVKVCDTPAEFTYHSAGCRLDVEVPAVLIGEHSGHPHDSKVQLDNIVELRF